VANPFHSTICLLRLTSSSTSAPQNSGQGILPKPNSC
jgi:hypothetical protein